MRLNVSVFNAIRPMRVQLRKWDRASVPRPTENPMRAIAHFARYMGMKTIPARTMAKLRSDPYFRYCFYQLKMHHEVYKMESPLGIMFRESMERLIKDPDSMTDNDLEMGLQQYMNNFPAYLPGGYKVSMFQGDFEASAGAQKIFQAVNRVLQEKGLTEEAVVTLRRGSKMDFTKLCLDIFNVLVERDRLDPEELWR